MTANAHKLRETLAREQATVEIVPVPPELRHATPEALEAAFQNSVSFQWDGTTPPEVTLAEMIGYFQTKLSAWGIDADGVGVTGALRDVFAPRLGKYARLEDVTATICAFSIKKGQSLVVSLRFNTPAADLGFDFNGWAQGILEVQDLGLSLEFTL